MAARGKNRCRQGIKGRKRRDLKATQRIGSEDQSLLFRERYFMQQLLFINSFYFHKDSECLVSAFVLADRKRLTTFGRTLVNDIKLRRGVLAEKIPKHKFRLGPGIGLDFALNGDINSLE
jgi:hypothetical protein